MEKQAHTKRFAEILDSVGQKNRGIINKGAKSKFIFLVYVIRLEKKVIWYKKNKSHNNNKYLRFLVISHFPMLFYSLVK